MSEAADHGECTPADQLSPGAHAHEGHDGWWLLPGESDPFPKGWYAEMRTALADDFRASAERFARRHGSRA